MSTTCYRIEVNGHLDDGCLGWFEGMKLMHTAEGNTIIEVAIPDQAALHGLLNQVFMFGLNLVGVMRQPVMNDKQFRRMDS